MQAGYKIALVTGASRGIGKAICQILVAKDINVLAVARHQDTLQDLRNELGEKITPLRCDVTNIEDIQAVIDNMPIDILVNNAGGLNKVAPLYEQSILDTQLMVNLNLIAPLQLMQLVLPGMIARKRGHIINLTSTVGQGVLPSTTVYGATKAALSQASKSLRYELAGTNVRVTDIAPGRVETEFFLESYGGNKEILNQSIFNKQRALKPEDVANAVWMALNTPERSTISQITITPTDQAQGGAIFASSD